MTMDDNSQKSLFFCSLLALQFGLQPILASKFTAVGVSKSSIVIATEITKILIAIFTIMGGPSAEREKLFETWSILDSLKVAALPATLYAIQNLLVQYGYACLDSMTFNLLNQTKVSGSIMQDKFVHNHTCTKLFVRIMRWTYHQCCNYHVLLQHYIT